MNKLRSAVFKVAAGFNSLLLLTGTCEALPTGPTTDELIEAAIKDPSAYRINLNPTATSLDDIDKALAEAQMHLASFPNQNVVISLPPGLIDISGDTGHEVFSRGKKNFSKVGINLGNRNAPEGSANLIISGAGKYKTTLIFNNSVDIFYGENVYRTYLSNMSIGTPSPATTQGVAVATGRGFVTIRIQPGFPNPQSIMDPEYISKAASTVWGRLIRKCSNSANAPEIITENNAQIKWDSTSLLNDGTWRMNFANPNQESSYKPGDLIAVKSKTRGKLLLFRNGKDIGFSHISITDKTAGYFMGNISNIFVYDFEIKRRPPIANQTPCLASSGGGLQFGQPKDQGLHDNIYISGFTSVGSGDDSLAFFNHVTHAVVDNSYISDSFASGIRIYSGYATPEIKVSPNVKMQRNEIVNSSSRNAAIEIPSTDDRD